MKEGKVVETDILSYDGKLWVPINVVPSLEEYFCRVYQMKNSMLKVVCLVRMIRLLEEFLEEQLQKQCG